MTNDKLWKDHRYRSRCFKNSRPNRIFKLPYIPQSLNTLERYSFTQTFCLLFYSRAWTKTQGD